MSNIIAVDFGGTSVRAALMEGKRILRLVKKDTLAKKGSKVVIKQLIDTIIEVKAPSEEKGIDQLKSYLNAEGCEIGVWSNGIDRVILYRNYPNNFEDTLSDIPSMDKTIDDLLEEKKTLDDFTDPDVNLKRTIEIMQELVLANAGVDVFNEVFIVGNSLIFLLDSLRYIRNGSICFNREDILP